MAQFYTDSFNKWDSPLDTDFWTLQAGNIAIVDTKAQRRTEGNTTVLVTYALPLNSNDHGVDVVINLDTANRFAGPILRSDSTGANCYFGILRSAGASGAEIADFILYRRVSSVDTALNTFTFAAPIAKGTPVIVRLEVENLDSGNVQFHLWHATFRSVWLDDGTYTDSAASKITSGKYTGMISLGDYNLGEQVSFDDWVAYDPFDTIWYDATRGYAGSLGTFNKPCSSMAELLDSVRTSNVNGPTTLYLLSDVAETVTIGNERHKGTSFSSSNKGLIVSSHSARRTWTETTSTTTVTINSNADYIEFRGIDFKIAGTSSIRTILMTEDKNSLVVGCFFELTKSTHTQVYNYGIKTGGNGTHLKVDHCYFEADPANSTYCLYAIRGNSTVGETQTNITASYCIFYGSIERPFYGFGAGQLDTSVFWHCSFADCGDLVTSTHGWRYGYTGGDGTSQTIYDCLFASSDYTNDNLTYGITMFGAGVANSTRNIFYQVDTPRSGAGIVSSNDLDSTDPAFKTTAPYVWPESALELQNVPGIALKKDWRPTNVTIRTYATDSTTPGALQGLGAQALPRLPDGDYRLLDASVVNTTPSFLSPTAVTDCNNIRITQQENRPAQLSFMVPADNYGFNGIGYGIFKHNRLVEVAVGYGSDNLQQGVFLIDEFERTHTSDGREFLIVKCVDGTKRLLDTVDLVYPDANVYLLTYDPNNRADNEPDLTTYPETFDSWTVAESVRALLSKARIPSSRQWGTYAPDHSGYTIEDIASQTRLRRSIGYSVPFPVRQREEAFLENKGADRWIGNPLWDRVQNLIGLYGMDMHFNANGDVVVAGASNPVRYDHKDVSLSVQSAGLPVTPTYGSNVRAFGGGYIDLSDGQTLIINNTANGWVGIELYFERTTTAGSVTIQLDGATLADYNGVDMSRTDGTYWYTDKANVDGSHPCIFVVAAGLTFSMHDITVAVSGSNVRFSGYGIYVRRERSNVDYTFAPGVLKRLSSSFDTKTLLNDVVVTGDNRDANNNVLVHGRSIDLASQDTPNAANFIGMPKQAWLHLEDIADNAHAQYIADAIIHRQRRIEASLDFQTFAHPHMEIGDNITAFEGGSSPSGSYWISSNDSSYNKGSNGSVTLLQTFRATPYEPFPSFDVPIDHPGIDASGTISNFVVTRSDGLNLATNAYDPYDAYPSDQTNKVVLNIGWQMHKEGLVWLRVRDKTSNNVEEVIENGTLLTPGDYTTTTNNHRIWTGKWWNNGGVPSEDGEWVASPNWPQRKMQVEEGKGVDWVDAGRSYMELEVKDPHSLKLLTTQLAEVDAAESGNSVFDVNLGDHTNVMGSLDLAIEHSPYYESTTGLPYRSTSSGRRWDIFSNDYTDNEGHSLGLRFLINVVSKESRIYLGGDLEVWHYLWATKTNNEGYTDIGFNAHLKWGPQHTNGTNALRLEVANDANGIRTIPVSNPTHWLTPQGGTGQHGEYVFYFNPNGVGNVDNSREIDQETNLIINLLYSDFSPETVTPDELWPDYPTFLPGTVSKGFAWYVGFVQPGKHIRAGIYGQDRSGRTFAAKFAHSAIDSRGRKDGRRYDQKAYENNKHGVDPFNQEDLAGDAIAGNTGNTDHVHYTLVQDDGNHSYD